MKTDSDGDPLSTTTKDSVIDPFTAQLAGLTSCDGSITGLQSEVQNCLQPAETQMNSQVQQFAAQFNAALTQAKGAIATQNLKVKDVQGQIDWIGVQLGGDGSGGAADNGLIAMQTKLETMVNSMDPNAQFSYGQVRQIEQAGQDIQQQQAMASADIANETMSKMRDCFNTVQPDETTLRCSPTGPPVSPLQYIQCTFNTNGNFINGQYNQSSFTQNAANANTQGLSAILNSMLGSVPQGVQYTTVQDPAQMVQTYGTMTLTALQSEFTQYIGASYGANTQSWVNTQLQNCYAKAYNIVVAEQNNPASLIGRDEYSLQQKMTTNQTAFNAFTQAYATEWSKDAGILWPGSYNSSNVLSSAGCLNTTLQNQSACLESLHTSLQGILTGAGQPAVQLNNIPTNYPGGESPYFGQGGTSIVCSGANAGAGGVCQCSGVIGCVQMYQNIRKERTTYKQTLNLQSQQYASSASSQLTTNILNPSVQMASQIAQQMRSQVQAVAQKLQSTFGLTDPITIPAITPGKPMGAAGAPPPDGDGLPTLPDGGAGALLSTVDLTQSLSDINTALAAATKKIGKEKEDLTTFIAQLKTKEASCQDQATMKTLDYQINQFVGSCSQGSNYLCPADNSASATLSGLVSDIQGAALSMGTDTAAGLSTNDVKSLQGVQSSCSGGGASGNAAQACSKVCSAAAVAINSGGGTGPGDCISTIQCAQGAAGCNNGILASAIGCYNAINAAQGVSNSIGNLQTGCNSAYEALQSAKTAFETKSGNGDADSKKGD